MAKHRRLLISVFGILIAVIALQFALPATVIAAPGESNTLRMYNYYDRGYSFDNSFPEPFTGHSSSFYSELRISKGGGVYSAYCIEFGVGAHTGDGFNSQGSYDWLTLSQQKKINLALMYGFNITKTGHVTTYSELDEYVGTQLLIWQVSSGFLNTDQEDRICEVVYVNNPGARGYYNQLKNTVLNYWNVPSFASERQSAAPTYELTYNTSNGRYETTLTDTNNAIGSMDISISGADVSISGNQLFVSVPAGTNVESIAGTVQKDYLDNNFQACTVDYWVSPNGMQSFVTPNLDGFPDPVRAYFNFKISTGNLRILKDSEDGVKQGFQFRVQGYGVDQVLTTDSSGKIKMDNIPAGNYQIAEVNADPIYKVPDAQTITVYGGQTTTANFYNKLKKGRVKLAKACSYHGEYLSGATYRIYKMNGTDTGQVITSNANEWVYSNELLYGSYYLKEQTAPDGFSLNETRFAFDILEDGDVKEIKVNNMPFSDVYPEFIQPNADYRAGTQVVSSWYIHSDGHVEWGKKPLVVKFEASYMKNGVKKVFSSQIKEAVCPANNKNLAYFKLWIPSDAEQVTFVCSVVTPNGVVETNEINNTVKRDFTIQQKPDSSAPDTIFENKLSGFTKPSASTQVPTGGAAPVAIASWDQWTYAGGTWEKVTYSAKLTVDHTAEPDADSPSRKKTGDNWMMRSGYGLSLASSSAMTTTGSPPASAYTLPQNENAYFPEFLFSSEQGKYRTLELLYDGKMSLYVNSASISSQGTPSNKRVHYVPLWYPDGEYPIQTYTYDAWCPAGMLSSTATLKTITIEQSAYDDWYLGK